MIVRLTAFALLVLTAFVPLQPGSAATPPPTPKGPAVDAALTYLRAVGSGDYPKAYGMLTRYAQRYFGTASNYASVWTSDRYKYIDPHAMQAFSQKGVQIVVVRSAASYFDPSTQTQRQRQITLPMLVQKENGAYRIDDEVHPYRAIAPQGATITHDGATVSINKIAFYPRQIELLITFQNDSGEVLTFLPYGRTVLRDDSAVYRSFQTRDWTITDRQLFLGLRLASPSRYTGIMNFEAPGRLDTKARTMTLTVAPAMRDGAESPLEFVLPPIAVPAP